MTHLKTSLNGAEKACAAVGSKSELARRLTAEGKKISAQGVRWWCTEIKAVPPQNGWAIAVAKITGLSLHELNPDVYPSERIAA